MHIQLTPTELLFGALERLTAKANHPRQTSVARAGISYSGQPATSAATTITASGQPRGGSVLSAPTSGAERGHFDIGPYHNVGPYHNGPGPIGAVE